MEKIARATFWALDCRDVARVDLRMDAEGRIYVLEVNPLPGLTPDYSDLVLIAKASGMEYDQLIAEIMQGGLRRLREKKREEREEREAREREKAPDKDKAKRVAKLDKGEANGNGHGNGKSDGTVRSAVKRERSEPTASQAAGSAPTATVSAATAERGE